MEGLALDLVVICGVVTIVVARPEIALGVLLAALFLAPAPLRVPHMHSAYLTVFHVFVLAGLLRMALRAADGRVGRRQLRMTPMHDAWVVFAAVVFAVGVVFVASAAAPAAAGLRMAELGAQAAFFVVSLMLVREMPDPTRAVGIVTAVVVLSAVVALGEHITGNAWGHFLFRFDPNAALTTDAAHPLSLRDGQTRVRAGAEFALQYSWLVVMVLPFIVVSLLRSTRRWLSVVLVGGLTLAVLAVYWSYTRSALVGVAAVVVLLAVVARERRAVMFAAAAIVVGVFVVAATPSVLQHASSGADTGSINSRFQRLAPILHVVAQHPFRGLGLGNLAQSGFGTTDNAFLLTYAELGAIGVAMLALLLLLALVQSGAAVLPVDDDQRLVGGACVAGVIAYIASAMFYDAFTLEQGAALLWFLVALATVVAERAGVSRQLLRPRPRWVAATALAGVALGTALFVLAPRHAAADALFSTVSISQQEGGDPVAGAAIFAGSVCDTARLTDEALRSATIDCKVDPSATGYGRLRFAAATRSEVNNAAGRLSFLVLQRMHIDAFRLYPLEPVSRGRATIWRTAPVWAPILALGLLILAPWRSPRFREDI